MRAVVAILTLALASPVAAHPCPSPSPAPKPAPKSPTPQPPTVQQFVDLYSRTGAAVQAARKVDETAAAPLLPRYRMINIHVGIRDGARRAKDAAELETLLAAAKKIAP